MGASGGPPTTFSSSASSSGLPPPPPPPKILLAKPSPGPAAPRLAARDDDPSVASVVLRSRNAPQPGSLNLLSDSWEIHTDRVLPFLTENTDFTVIGVIGPPSVGKSTIMNELYGSDGSSPGMLPPFATQSDETRAMLKHCTMGIELRVSGERLILLDAQPVFSPSILVDMVRPDGLSTIPVLNGEPLSADLAHEIMGIQHMIPDPSLPTSGHSQGSNPVPDKDINSNPQATSEEYLAALIFIHTKLRDQELSPSKVVMLRKALMQYMGSSFNMNRCGKLLKTQIDSSSVRMTNSNDSDSVGEKLFVLPLNLQDDTKKDQFESYCSMLGKLHDQLLSIKGQSFAKTVSERDWLRNSAKIWDLVKKSPTIADYCKTLQNSGLFRSALRQGADPNGLIDKRKERHRSGHM